MESKTPTVTTDEELMRCWQQGNRSALDEIVLRYHTPVYRYLFRATAQHYLAEDLTQDCFVRLVHSGHQYEYPRPLRPWLYTIATNAMRRHFESAYQRHTTFLAEQDEGMAAEDETPHLLTGRWDDRAELLAVFGHLSAEHRAVITLRYTEDFSLAEIAAILHLPLGTVKTRLLRALHRLRLLLESRREEESHHAG